VADAQELALIGDALEELGKVDADLAEIVDLKFFCGFSFVEIAAMRGVSERKCTHLISILSRWPVRAN